MHLTIIHPAIGHIAHKNYIKSWQMEPLPAAAIAGLTPKDVQISFFDDRMEKIDYEAPTDLVAISVETYTAKRAYQIASQYRKKGIPVVMGGFHATLMLDEVKKYADAVVIGEAELVWADLIRDFKKGELKRVYQGTVRPDLGNTNTDRSIFKDKRYLPIGLIETGRGCKYSCDFCAVQSFFKSTYKARPIEEVVEEIKTLKKDKKLFFFVDDNFIGDKKRAKELLRALIPLKIRWVTQMSIDGAFDEELLELMDKSGCAGVLIGFETLNPQNLKLMGKGFNQAYGNYENALKKLKKHHIRIYATFVFGYDHDRVETFKEVVDFAKEHDFYIAAFNHLTPFPGTPLYEKLQKEGRLRFDKWWLDDAYRYNDLPFVPKGLEPWEVTKLCVEARREFYSIGSIFKRILSPQNRSNGFMFRNYFPINWMHRGDIDGRNGYPLGDENYKEELIEVRD